MASAYVFFTFFLFNMTLISPFFANGEDSDGFAKSVLMNGTEKLTNLHFYFHDIISGTKPTAVQIAGPENFIGTGFGTTSMMDDALTEGPEPTSKVIGRAQGIYASAAQDELGLLMVLNFAFLEGPYNGSTLSVLGKNSVFHSVREMPIVGGSGFFRFARGYALAHTVWFNDKGDAIVQYNVSVLHY